MKKLLRKLACPEHAFYVTILPTPALVCESGHLHINPYKVWLLMKKQRQTPDETASESPNQESTATETHDIAHHSPFESQSQAIPTTPKKRIRSSKKPHPGKNERNKR